MANDSVASISNQLSSLSVRDVPYVGPSDKGHHHRHHRSDNQTYAEYEDDDLAPAPRERLDSHDSASSSNSGDSAISTGTTSSDEYDEDRLAELETARAVRKYSQRMVFLTRRQFEAFCANLERKKRYASISHSHTRRAHSGI